MVAYNELFECLNCYHTGPLTQHGQCESCGSCTVMSTHVRTRHTEQCVDEPLFYYEWREEITK